MMEMRARAPRSERRPMPKAVVACDEGAAAQTGLSPQLAADLAAIVSDVLGPAHAARMSAHRPVVPAS